MMMVILVVVVTVDGGIFSIPFTQFQRQRNIGQTSQIQRFDGIIRGIFGLGDYFDNMYVTRIELASPPQVSQSVIEIN
jgi:hypothetical protein